MRVKCSTCGYREPPYAYCLFIRTTKINSVIGSPVQQALAFCRDGPGSCPILGRTYKQCHGMFRLQEKIQQF